MNVYIKYTEAKSIGSKQYISNIDRITGEIKCTATGEIFHTMLQQLIDKANRNQDIKHLKQDG